jgi:hypothetical protein
MATFEYHTREGRFLPFWRVIDPSPDDFMATLERVGARDYYRIIIHGKPCFISPDWASRHKIDATPTSDAELQRMAERRYFGRVKSHKNLRRDLTMVQKEFRRLKQLDQQRVKKAQEETETATYSYAIGADTIVAAYDMAAEIPEDEGGFSIENMVNLMIGAADEEEEWCLILWIDVVDV